MESFLSGKRVGPRMDSQVPGGTTTTLVAKQLWMPSDPSSTCLLLALGCPLGLIPTAGIKGTEMPTKCKNWISLQRQQESPPREPSLEPTGGRQARVREYRLPCDARQPQRTGSVGAAVPTGCHSASWKQDHLCPVGRK